MRWKTTRRRVAELLAGLSIDDVARVLVYAAHLACRRTEVDAMRWAAELIETRRRVEEIDALELAWQEPETGPAASTPVVSAYEALFPAGTSEEQAERWAAQDAADDQVQAELDAERDHQVAAAAVMTEQEYESIFGDG